MGIITLTLAVGVMVGCVSVERYKQENQNLKQENVKLAQENEALKNDCIQLQSQVEELVKQLKKQQEKTSYEPQPAQSESNLPAIVKQLESKGLEIVYRDEHPAVVVTGLFTPGSTKLTKSGKTDLKKVVKEIKSELPGCSLKVVGYTDNQPIEKSTKYKDNKELSLARAKSVVSYLISDCGWPRHRLAAEGLGEAKPIADNKKPEGREKNRRIELVIIIKD
jgi:chemotaxis protein MotB